MNDDTKKEMAAPEDIPANIATMTAAELAQHIATLEHLHRAHMRALRALTRVRKAEEESRR